MNKKIFEHSTLLLLVMSVLLNVGLTNKVHDLEKLLNPKSSSVIVGETVSGFNVRGLSGEPRRIDFTAQGSPTVLYVFSPTCGWCAKNLDNIKELYSHEHNAFRFVGVSLSSEGLAKYVSASGFPLEVVTSPSAELVSKLQLGSTPETIVIDPSGIIRKVWVGAYQPKTSKEIEDYFRLPRNTLRGQ